MACIVMARPCVLTSGDPGKKKTSTDPLYFFKKKKAICLLVDLGGGGGGGGGVACRRSTVDGIREWSGGTADRPRAATDFLRDATDYGWWCVCRAGILAGAAGFICVVAGGCCVDSHMVEHDRTLDRTEAVKS